MSEVSIVARARQAFGCWCAVQPNGLHEWYPTGPRIIVDSESVCAWLDEHAPRWWRDWSSEDEAIEALQRFACAYERCIG